MRRFKTINLQYELEPRKDCLYCGTSFKKPSRTRQREYCDNNCRHAFNNNAAQLLRPFIKKQINEMTTNFVDWVAKVSGKGLINLKFKGE